jgi:hypothetical protein
MQIMDFHIDEIEKWEKEIDPVYRKAQRLKQVRQQLLKDDWALHWLIDSNE